MSKRQSRGGEGLEPTCELSPEALMAPSRLVDGKDGTADGAWAGALLGKLGEVDDEPFARERVWQRLRARRNPSRRRVPYLAVAATAAALVTLGIVSQGVGPPDVAVELAVVTLAQGKVYASAPDAATVEVQAGALLVADSRVDTGADGRAVVRFLTPNAAAARVLLDHETRATFGRHEDAATIDLAVGKLVAQAPPRGEPFGVRVGEHRISEHRAAMLGTVFAVDAGADDLSVAVHAGAVQVAGAATNVRINAGQCWTRRSGIVACGQQIDQSLIDLLAGRDAKAALSPANASDAPAVPERSLTARPGRNGAPTKAASPRAADGTPSDPVQALKKRLAEAAGGAERDALLYDLGVILTRLGRYADAIDAFSEVSRGVSTHAELALYEVGRVKERYLADPKGALAALEAYRRRYAGGVLRQEVDLTLIETVLALGHLDRAASELDAFLQAHPTSERTADVLLLRGNVRRSRGQCAAALADYDASAQIAGHGAVADDAHYFAAVCAATLGDARGARRRLGTYLEKFANGLHRGEAEQALQGK